MTKESGTKVANKPERRKKNKKKGSKRESNKDQTEESETSWWDPITTSKVLIAPMASRWIDGMAINDQEGKQVYQILSEDTDGRMKTGDQKHRATIASPEGKEVIAVVVRKVINMTDSFVIYSTKPNWDGQEAEPYMLQKTKQFDMYPRAYIQQSIFGKKYTVKLSKDDSVLLKAKNGNIRTTLLCCPMCLLLDMFRWRLEFYQPGQHPRQNLILRNQDTETLEIAFGSSPLLGLCISYAVDRLTSPTC